MEMNVLRCSVDWGTGIGKECSWKWAIKVHSLINQGRFLKWDYCCVTECTLEAENFAERTFDAESYWTPDKTTQTNNFHKSLLKRVRKKLISSVKGTTMYNTS